MYRICLPQHDELTLHWVWKEAFGFALGDRDPPQTITLDASRLLDDSLWTFKFVPDTNILHFQESVYWLWHVCLFIWLNVVTEWALIPPHTSGKISSVCAAGEPCSPAVATVCAMCLCWCCVCLRLRTSTGQRTTTAPSIMALFQLVFTYFLQSPLFILPTGPRWSIVAFVRIFMGCRRFSLSNRRSLGQRWKRTEHLGCVQSQKGQNPTKWHGGFLLWKLLQNQGEDSERFQKCRSLCCVKAQVKLNISLHCMCFVQDDISLMKEIRLNHYRFSISWPRIIPTGVKCK